FSRSRWSASSLSASIRVRSAVSIASSIDFWRRSRASRIAGNAKRRSSSIEAANTSRVQTISPTLGVIRKLPDDATIGSGTGMRRLVDDERREQAGDEPVEETGLGQCEAEPLD